MIVTVFRSRLNLDAQDEYGAMAKRMSELARSIPGYISHKGFVAEDGERVTIVEFESEEALREWRFHPEHAEAKRRGIENFFSDYKFQICNVIRARVWAAKAEPRSSREPARGRPLLTSELIDRHRRLAHEMRSTAIRQAIPAAIRAFLRVIQKARFPRSRCIRDKRDGIED